MKPTGGRPGLGLVRRIRRRSESNDDVPSCGGREESRDFALPPFATKKSSIHRRCFRGLYKFVGGGQAADRGVGRAARGRRARRARRRRRDARGLRRRHRAVPSPARGLTGMSELVS